jgi:hypothetical protein
MLTRNFPGAIFLALACCHVTALAQKPVQVTVTRQVVHPKFGGVGFHADFSLPSSTPEHFEQVLAKRWSELQPSFARVSHWWKEDRPGIRDVKGLQALAKQLVFMKESANTEIYFTTMGLGPVRQGKPRLKYVKAVVDDLEYLWKQGATNLKTFCVTNELSASDWADLTKDLPTFRNYHQLLFEELKKRNLPIRLLATDASPIENWNTLEWAAKNMDEITGVYGGHHYINDQGLDDLGFYGWFKDKCGWAAGLAKAKGKDFILGEFGPAQYFDKKHGLRWDTCLYYETPQEPLAGIQLAEAALAAVNAGVYGMGYWTFTDFPDHPEWRGINQWGLFKWLTNSSVPRAPYFAYGLLTKFFRGPAIVYAVRTADEQLRVAAIEQENKTWSIAIVNRNPEQTPVHLSMPEGVPAASFRKYVYDPKHLPLTEDGDLQGPSGKVSLEKGTLADSLAGGTLTVYTTAYDETPPAPVRGLQVSKLSDSQQLTWLPSTETDLCYYRIYHNNLRVGSTIATSFADAGPTQGRSGNYTVIAVDRSGNASQP